MKQTARIISTYSADAFGVCSALFELGGMTVMHDASGCNSTYTTHDEPRWYDMDGMVYISGLSEMEAIMGDDEKLIGDIAAAAAELHPRFIAIAGTPIPAMTGFDYTAVAELIEQRTGIPAMGFATTGMNTYIHGAAMALDAIARRFVRPDCAKTAAPSVNILGLTPLDFSINGTDRSIARFVEENGFAVLSRWAMGDTLDTLAQAGGAHVNLVVSAAGLTAAQTLQQRFGTPYVIGMPVAGPWADRLAQALRQAAATGENQAPRSDLSGGEIAVIGEGVTSLSLASAIELASHQGARVLCATECDRALLRDKDEMTPDEADIEPALTSARVVIADPLYRPICPKSAAFVPLPTEAFSGRMFRSAIPNLADGLPHCIEEVF